MKPSYCRGGRVCRPQAILFRYSLAAILLAFSNVFSQVSDVLLVEKPEHLSIYDSFQQSLSPSQVRTLRPYVPIRVLKARELFSDGLTSCMKVAIEGEVYYLLLADDGKISGWRDLGRIEIFRQRKFFDDTIAVTDSGRVQFQQVARRVPVFLQRGVHCVRYFENNGKVYGKTLGQGSAYGWIRLEESQRGKAWNIIRTLPAVIRLSDATIGRVREKIDDVNRSFAEIYTVLQSETGKVLPVPRWRIDSTSTTITCTLLPATSAGTYRKSIDALAATFQAYLLGTEFDAVAGENRIEITPR